MLAAACEKTTEDGRGAVPKIGYAILVFGFHGKTLVGEAPLSSFPHSAKKTVSRFGSLFREIEEGPIYV